MKPSHAIIALIAAVALALPGGAVDSAPGATPAAAAAPTPYPFDTCIVSGEKFGGADMGDPVVFVHAGHEVKLCCASCRKKFDKRAAEYIQIIDDGIKARQSGGTPVNPAAEPAIADPAKAGAEPAAEPKPEAAPQPAPGK